MSKMTWFKLHSEFRNDPKVKRLPIAERYAFIILLCLASESATRGVITGLDDDDIAFELEMQSEDWKTLKAKFKVKGFIDFSQEEILIRNWDKRQYDKPSDHPDATKQRKRLQRERDKLAKSQDVTPCHADVTAMSPTRVEEIRSEEIRSDQTKQDPHINNSCARVNSKISDIEKFELRWKPQEIDCSELAQDIDFREFVLNRLQKLPSTKKGEWEPDMADAAKNIASGQFDLKRRGEIKILYEEYVKSKKSEASSPQKTQKDDRPRLLKPNPMAWTTEQENWTYEQWEKFLHDQGNSKIYAEY
jgi:hypothetical protein